MKFLLCIAALFFIASASAAPPSLGTDCGIGASIDANATKEYGKLVIGASPTGCTLGFSWQRAPSCSAMVERTTDPGSSFVPPSPLGTITTATSLFISDASGLVPTLQEGFVVSYMCIGK